MDFQRVAKKESLKLFIVIRKSRGGIQRAKVHWGSPIFYDGCYRELNPEPLNLRLLPLATG